MQIIRYTAEFASDWNRFVDDSRNGTFLLRRDYMDYHSDRFDDCSWIALKKGKPVALLPANLTADGVLHSHGGLTYGGWILPTAHLDGADLLEIFGEACEEWRRRGIAALDYKPVPYIYDRQPSAEDEYALFRLGAQLTECNISASIDLRNPGGFNKLRRRHLAKANSLPISVHETTDVVSFMAMLGECLAERHGVAPVHSAEELKLLMSRFPENIRLYVTEYEGGPHAGICIYDTGMVAHAQYIATSAPGRELNLLTPLVHWLVTERYAGRRYFDFGISTEEHGKYLNAGLLRQKYSFGATAVSYMRYHLPLA